MSDQEQILSYAADQVLRKVASWFPKEKVSLWQGKYKEGIFLWVHSLEDAKNHNRMETLRVKKSDKAGEVEVQVPAPRMVHLSFAVVCSFADVSKALDCSARLIRSAGDDPFVKMEKHNWYGNEEARTMLEEPAGALPALPGELAVHNPLRRDFQIALGINSAKEEKIVRVQKRQFTAVKK